MDNSLTHPRTETETSLTHTVVVVFALIGLLAGVMAIGVELSGNRGGSSTTTTATAAAPASALINVTGTPSTGWKAANPALAPATAATEHKITLHAVEATLEVAPGVKQLMWTFNGTVPGPVLRGHVGDLFTITLVNDSQTGHSVDFHASQVAPNVDMRTIAPGSKLVYQFRATHSGIWMYHCGTPPVLHHVGNGMYGAVIIDPPNLAPVAHEFAFVQSELYKDGTTDAGYQNMLEKRWSALMFNGDANQYANAPIQVQAHQRIRAWVLDAGPSEDTSFHVIGTIFDTVYKEGRYELQPGSGGSQALDLQPAQGGFVEFVVQQPGRYPFLTHDLADASAGALGVFQAGPAAR